MYLDISGAAGAKNKYMTLSLEKSVPVRQDRLSRSLMGLAAVGALVAFVSGVNSLATAPASEVWLETWRAFGFLMFTGMFILLALRPRRSPGIWELAFFHKAALAISAIFLRDDPAAVSAGTVDAVLALLLLTAYLCARGWRGWAR